MQLLIKGTQKNTYSQKKKAKILKKGIWQGEFDRPEDWRRKYN